mgnify:CR=1 FL=1
MGSRVALVESVGHREGVSKALSLLREELEALKGARQVVVKPNFVSAWRKLSATPVDAVRAVLDVVARHYKGTVIVAEAPALGTFSEALRSFGYLSLAEEYDVEFLDLGEDDYEVVEIWDSRFRRGVRVRVSRTVLESDYLISVVRPKTHDTVVVTLTIKNVVMGAVQPGWRRLVHQGYAAINLNIAYLARLMKIKLAVVDGYVGMEGNGPVGGEPVELGVALAGADPLAVDSMATRLMGFKPEDVGYLYYLKLMGYGHMELDEIEIIGLKDWERYVKKFRPHRTYRAQLRWKEGIVEALRELGIAPGTG